MSNYKFDPLSDREFEEFCCDVLSQYLSVKIELFKPGKDAGIDGRFFDGQNTCIIQCKRYIHTPFSALFANLKKEVPKVKKIDPVRYIIATSLDLSPANKKEIFSLFSPYIKSETDIFSGSDLLYFLDLPNYDHILKKNYKLWFTSTSALEKILNNAIIGRSQSELKEIIENSSKYILTDDFYNALDKLQDTHTAILTGAPGIGKTTLARLLALHYVGHYDFEFYTIFDDLSELEAVWHPDKKQVFYFDDFLGKNYLEAIEKNADSHIMSFISRVKSAKNKRFILTSRTHIINHAVVLSQIFQDANVQRNEYEVKIENLSLKSKAKILYNHIFHSELPREFIDEIYANKKYLDIVHHQNFNPRLISYITDAYKITKDNEIIAKDYINFINKSLAFPAGIWENAFAIQLTHLQRFLVIIVFWNKSECSENLLRDAFEYIKERLPHYLAGNLQTDFFSNIKVAIRSLLTKNINRTKKITTYSLFNPSLGDYLLGKYLDDVQYGLYPLLALKSQQSLSLFLSLGESKYKYNKTWTSIAEQIFDNFQKEKYSFDYIFRFCYFVLSNKTTIAVSKVVKYIQNINLFDVNTEDAEYFLYTIEWCLDNDIEIDLSCFGNSDYIDFISEHIYNCDTLVILNKIIQFKNTAYTQEFFSAIERCVQEKSAEFAQYVATEHDCLDEDSFYQYLYDDIINFLQDSQLPIEDIDFGVCTQDIDAADYIKSQYEDNDFDYEEYIKKQKEEQRTINDEIEDIFYREEN